MLKGGRELDTKMCPKIEWHFQYICVVSNCIIFQYMFKLFKNDLLWQICWKGKHMTWDIELSITHMFWLSFTFVMIHLFSCVHADSLLYQLAQIDFSFSSFLLNFFFASLSKKKEQDFLACVRNFCMRA
jgi:hypothetical protein